MRGGVRTLVFDALEEARLVTFGGTNGSCQSGNCNCLLRILHQFTHLTELVIDDARLTKCLGRGAAPYTQGLPSSVTHLTIVLRQSFLRWLHKTFRQDYPLAKATPLLRMLQIGEVSSLEERAKNRIHIGKSSVTHAAPAFSRLVTTLPPNLAYLGLPPTSVELQADMLPKSLTKTSMLIRYKPRSVNIPLPASLVSLHVQISDPSLLDKHHDTIFPKTLTDLTVFLQLKITEDGKIVTNANNSSSNSMDVDDGNGSNASSPKWIKYLPPVNSLHLHNIDNIRLADLPPVLTHFRLTSWWPAKGTFDARDWRPAYLSYCRIQRWDPVSQEFLNNLPKTIDHLVLKTDKPTTISKMPETLTKLTLPAQASFVAHKWPSQLTCLKVNRLTNLPADVLVDMPKTLTKLTLSCPPATTTTLKDYFKDLPPTILHLSLCNRKVDSSLFESLKDSKLVSLEIFAGDSRRELLVVDIPSFRWELLQHLPSTLKRLYLPVSVANLTIRDPSLENLVDLSLPNATIGFEALQLLLVFSPNLRRLLAKQFQIKATELADANKLLATNPFITLHSVKVSTTKE